MSVKILAASLLCSTVLPSANVAFAQTEASKEQQASSSNAINDIVVTARRRAERAQDAPISISVASAQDLERKSITSFPDLVRETPSLRLAPAGLSSSSTFLAMRGQFVVDTRVNVDPAIAVYIDGVYQARAVGTEQFGMLDVDQVEILKGPQGTLFGKNTTGGAINITTAAPSDTFEGKARVRVAEGGELAIGGVINVPIASNLAFRAVADLNFRDGYGRDGVTHIRNGHLDSQQFRASLKFDPTDTLSILLRGDYAQSRSNALAFNGLSAIAIDGSAVTEVMAETGLSRPDAFALLQTYDRRSQDSDNEVRSSDRAKLFGWSTMVDLELSDNISIKSLTAMRYIRKEGATDPDGTPFQILEYPYTMVRDHQFSQELQLSGTAIDKRLNYVLGGYYADEKGTEINIQRTLGFLSAAGNGNTVYDGTVRNRTFGVFAQATLKLMDQLSATGGVRYTKDWRDLESRNRNNRFCLAEGVSMALAGATCEFDVPEAKFDHISYTASLEYKPTNNILIYAKTSNGYRTGALPINGGNPTSPAAAAFSFTPARPETITDYEIGLKADWLDRRLRTNIAAFHGIYKDIQRVRPTVVPGTTQLLPLLENIAAAKIDGVEVQVIAQPVHGLELKGAVDYLRARYTDYVVNGVDMSALPLAFTPKWAYNLSAAYTVDTGIGPWRTQVDFSHQTSMLAVPNRGYVQAYGLLNARTSVTIESADMDIAVFARNLTKETYYAAPADVAALGFIYNSQINPPRVFGFEATKRF